MIKKITRLAENKIAKAYDTFRSAATYTPLGVGLAAKIATCFPETLEQLTYPEIANSLSYISNPAIAAGAAIALADGIDIRIEKKYGPAYKQFLLKAASYTALANLTNLVLTEGIRLQNHATAKTTKFGQEILKIKPKSTSTYQKTSPENFGKLIDYLNNNFIETYQTTAHTLSNIYRNGFKEGIEVSDTKQAAGLFNLTLAGLLVIPVVARSIKRILKPFITPALTYRQRRAEK